jgi:Cyclin, N-terminal domain
MSRELRTTSTRIPVAIETLMESIHDVTIEQVKGYNDASEYLQILISQERKLYSLPIDYISAIQWTPSTNSDSDPVSEVWRRKLCEWCYEVVDHFGFDREVVSIALNFLDRSVAVKTQQSGTNITRREFQLFAVTSLYMAVKVHGETESAVGPRQKLRIDAFVQLSRGFFQIDVIEAKERDILSDLSWHVNPPTSLKYIATYLRLCPKWQPLCRSYCQASILGSVYDVARYLSELSVCVSQFSFQFKTSVIGFAAIICAIEALQNTMPLPYTVRLAFLNNIAEVSQLKSTDPDVQSVCKKLKDLCPHLFEGDDFPLEFFADRTLGIVAPDSSQSGGKVSPICVTTSHHQIEVNTNTRRKRSRSNSENWQAIDRSRS